MMPGPAPYWMLQKAIERERKTMALTPEEKQKLKTLNKKFEQGAKDIGEAIAEGSTTLARSAARSIREWATEIEKMLGEKDEKKP